MVAAAVALPETANSDAIRQVVAKVIGFNVQHTSTEDMGQTSTEVEELVRAAFCVPWKVSKIPHFWLFMLNGQDEANEISEWYLHPLPSGSLLEWVDAMFQPNSGAGERTVGRQFNIDEFGGGAETLKEKPCGNTQPDEDLVDDLVDRTTKSDVEWREFADFGRLPMAVPGVPPGYVHIYMTRHSAALELRAPLKHGDFSHPRFLGQVLCRVERKTFPNRFCDWDVSPPPTNNDSRFVNFWPGWGT